MLIYENERTKNIVTHLVRIGNTLRWIIIIVTMIVLSAMLALAGGIIRPEWWLFGALFGVVLGYGLGDFIASMITVGIEWMAQMLIAQGEILEALKK
jgi:hypothetical protein